MKSPVEQRLSDALHDIVDTQPFEPDPAAIERRGRRLQRRAVTVRIAGTGVAAAAVAVAVGAMVIPDVPGSQSTALPATHQTTPTTGTSAAQQPLVRLADYLKTAPKPTGDATLVMRDQNYPSTGLRVVAWDLYGDDGTYYFARTRAGLPAQVVGHKSRGEGIFGREVAAAEYAATGDLNTARDEMADAPTNPGDPKAISRTNDKSLIDNWVWEDSLDALTAGAGNPVVRAGVLRLLSTLSEVTVTDTTTTGQATLTLTDTEPVVKDGPKSSSGYTEALCINADTGVPVTFHGGDQAQSPGIDINYEVSRVTLADVAAGTF